MNPTSKLRLATGSAEDPQGAHPKVLSPLRKWRWFAALLLLVALAVIASMRAEQRKFAELLERAESAWLLVIVALQIGTYACLVHVWAAVIRRVNHSSPSPYWLARLALAELFTDQALPSARAFISFISVSVGATTLRMAMPPASFARRSWSFSVSLSLVEFSICARSSATRALILFLRPPIDDRCRVLVESDPSRAPQIGDGDVLELSLELFADDVSARQRRDIGKHLPNG